MVCRGGEARRGRHGPFCAAGQRPWFPPKIASAAKQASHTTQQTTVRAHLQQHELHRGDSRATQTSSAIRDGETDSGQPDPRLEIDDHQLHHRLAKEQLDLNTLKSKVWLIRKGNLEGHDWRKDT